MTDEDGYRVYMVNFPPTIRGAVRLSEDGFASIYINDALSSEAKKKALEHELRHLRRNDFFNGEPIEVIECQE